MQYITLFSSRYLFSLSSATMRAKKLGKCEWNSEIQEKGRWNFGIYRNFKSRQRILFLPAPHPRSVESSIKILDAWRMRQGIMRDDLKKGDYQRATSHIAKGQVSHQNRKKEYLLIYWSVPLLKPKSMISTNPKIRWRVIRLAVSNLGGLKGI